MKIFTLHIRILYFLLFIIVIATAGFAFFQFNTTNAQGLEYKVAGWLYSDNYGWISLNSDNPGLPDGAGYAVVLNSSNNISGYGWSSNVGWVCFGSSCNATDCANGEDAPRGGLPTAHLDQDTGEITGWAHVCSLELDGWIDLRPSGTVSAPASGEYCYGCEPACEVYAEVCDEFGDDCVPDLDRCLYYYTDKYDSCQICFAKTYFNVPQPIGTPPEEAIAGGSGEVCYGCTGNGASGHQNEYCRDEVVPAVGTRTICSDCSAPATCQQYGVSSNLDDGSLVGWAFNGTDDGDVNNIYGYTGAGWLRFNTQYGANIVYPWLETQYGSIYTGDEFRQRTGIKVNNATYCIFADSIQHVRSENCTSNVSGVVGGVQFDFPITSANTDVYYNALGSIDVTGLITETSPGSDKNKFSQDIVSDKDFFKNWNNSASELGNKVYYIDGDLTIDDLLVFNNGTEGERGNGTIVVNGDLNINANIKYNGSLPSDLDLKKLSSVAWVVMGDVVVHPDVTSIVGAFIVLGDGDITHCLNNCDLGGFPEYEQGGDGVFFSGTKSPGEADESLTVVGMVVAKAFDFRRKFASLLEGSERIIYDGRLIANPPPGMKSFSEGLPLIRDFSF